MHGAVSLLCSFISVNHSIYNLRLILVIFINELDYFINDIIIFYLSLNVTESFRQRAIPPQTGQICLIDIDRAVKNALLILPLLTNLEIEGLFLSLLRVYIRPGHNDINQFSNRIDALLEDG